MSSFRSPRTQNRGVVNREVVERPDGLRIVVLTLFTVSYDRNGRANCLGCPTYLKRGRATALAAHYVPAPISESYVDILMERCD